MPSQEGSGAREGRRNQKLQESRNRELQGKVSGKKVKKQVRSRSSDKMQDEKQRPRDARGLLMVTKKVKTRLPL